jgi:hypothetical protein
MNDDDFDNDMGLPEDELTGGSGMTESGDLGLGMEGEDDMDAAAPGRPSGGARARGSSGMRTPKPAAAAPAGRKSAAKAKKSGVKKKSGAKKKKGARKAARKTARKAARKSARKGARKGSMKRARGRKKGGRRR